MKSLRPGEQGIAKMNRIRTLDGWRGIAILFVLAEHAGVEHFKNQTWSGLGSLGVDIFFVLSGYIITARLLDEREKSSTINLSSFYMRRAFRILPLLVSFLCVLCALSLFLSMDLRPSQIAGSLFFFRNYQYAALGEGIYTAHFWSLSIEEHFYLLWPLLLLRLGNRRAAWFAGIGAVLCGLWRWYDGIFPNGPVGRLLPGATAGFRSLRTDARIDGLLLGYVLALLLLHPQVLEFIRRNFPKETPLLCGCLLILNQQWNHGYPTLTSYLLITLMLASTLIVKEGLVYQWLNSRLLAGIGTISYSLYVWQQLFLLHPVAAHPLGKLSVFPYNLACAFVLASSSYYFLEQPMQKLGKRLMQERTPAASVALAPTAGEPS
jgi:peptidoglycan/LPS O-acetylase OafA/YrhL